MYKSILVLPDGTELSSGVSGSDAIEGLTLTRSVNEETELTLGSVCAAMLEVSVLLSGESVALQAGSELTLYRQNSTGQEKLGVFLVNKLTRAGKKLKITAYDRISLLDRELSEWLNGLQAWPYTLGDFAQGVAQACGVTVDTSGLLNPQLPVSRFLASGISGRQLLRWVGQLGGAFCCADENGQLYYSWYFDRGTVLAPTGENFYYQGSLQSQEHTVAPVEKVWLRQNQQDVGTVYPDTAQSANTYILTGNPILAGLDTETRLAVAQSLYERLRQVSYRPCRVQICGDYDVCAGEIVTVTTPQGDSFFSYIMTQKQKAYRSTLESTGSPTRDSTEVFNQLSYRSLAQRVMELKTDSEGLRATATAQQTALEQEKQDMALLEQSVSELALSAEGIQAQVQCQTEKADYLYQELTRIEQNAAGLSLAVQTIESQGVDQVTTSTGYRFSADGLRIKKEGQQMENLLTDTGMYVSRGDTVLLQADQNGVSATDVTVNNYLIIGEHSRFEDHTDDAGNNRTACFWLD